MGWSEGDGKDYRCRHLVERVRRGGGKGKKGRGKETVKVRRGCGREGMGWRERNTIHLPHR